MGKMPVWMGRTSREGFRVCMQEYLRMWTGTPHEFIWALTLFGPDVVSRLPRQLDE